MYLPVELRRTGERQLAMHLTAVELPMLTAGFLHFGTDVFIGGDEVPAYYIEAPLSGVARNTRRDGRTEVTSAGSAAVFSPGMPVDLDWSTDCREIRLKVSEVQMRRQLETMLGHPVHQRITFARKMTLKSRAARNWFSLVRILANDAGRSDGVPAHHLAMDNLQNMLVEGLLRIQPHNFSEALAARAHSADVTTVKRAVDLMHAFPETSWNTGELAHAVGVTARGLQKAFQRAGYLPPMAYLRRLRLEGVHAELTDGGPEATSVTSVAGRWGFVHLGRFADQYRQQFGQKPSETLRTTRQGGSRSASLTDVNISKVSVASTASNPALTTPIAGATKPKPMSSSAVSSVAT